MNSSFLILSIIAVIFWFSIYSANANSAIPTTSFQKQPNVNLNPDMLLSTSAQPNIILSDDDTTNSNNADLDSINAQLIALLGTISTLSTEDDIANVLADDDDIFGPAIMTTFDFIDNIKAQGENTEFDFIDNAKVQGNDFDFI